MSGNKILLVGNCQMPIVADCLSLMLPEHEVVSQMWGPFVRQNGAVAGLFADVGQIFTQPQMAPTLRAEAENQGWKGTIRTVPAIYFMGLHPDAVYAFHEGQQLGGATGGLTSAIALYAWKKGVPLDEVKELFTPDVFRRLGYLDYWDEGRTLLLDSARNTDVPLDDLFDGWAARKPFMHIVNHPKLLVLADIARKLTGLVGAKPLAVNPEDVMSDRLIDSIVWPVYPGVAENIGLRGSFIFKMGNSAKKMGESRKVMDLDAYLASSYATYGELKNPDAIVCQRFGDKRFLRLDEVLEERKRRPAAPPRSTTNPYRGLPDYQFWRNAVAAPAREDVDPVVRPVFTIERDTKVATAGSCFAQHIARALKGSGYNYYVAEPGSKGMSEEAKAERQYGLFSARYGNIYTSRQLLQLIRHAYRTRTPVDSIWRRPDGRFVDPLRSSVEPDGFGSEAKLVADRDRHLAAVREMFERLDVFVFTLGLTETWESTVDGTVFPTAPGVVTDQIDVSKYRFVNLGVEDVVDDMTAFLAELAKVNPAARVILTVSPVPLVATYENRHVLVSTTYSKAVLRVAAEQIAKAHENVAYFPSYEIVTGNHARGAYFEEDLRSVQPAAVSHVMRLFLSHYGKLATSAAAAQPARPAPAASTPPKLMSAEFEAGAAVICDEERLDEGLAKPAKKSKAAAGA